MRKRSKWKFVPPEFEESTQIICNPGRGWYEIYTFCIGQGCREEELERVREVCDGPDTLALLLICLEHAGDGLTQKQLDSADRILHAFAGKRDILLRFVYDLAGKGMEQEPGQFSQVERHLEQLAPLLRKYAPYLYVYQGMLVGSWGEMHTSRYLSGKYVKKLGRKLADISGGQFFLAVRKPSQWRQIFSSEDVEMAVKRAKIGLFNDGILGSDTDLGTYGTSARDTAGWEAAWLPEEELWFQERLCQYVPNGGEAVYGQYTARQPLEGIVERLRSVHIGYLNRCHDKRVLEYWKALKWEEEGVWKGMNGLDYIGCHLGYRFFVEYADMQWEPRSEYAVLYVDIKNVGFSNMYESAQLFVEHEDLEGQCHRDMVSCDVTGWGSGGTVRVSHRVPLREGNFYLSLRRAKDQRSILFANGGHGMERVLLGRLHCL